MSVNDTVSRSWFVVLNNPIEHGYNGKPEEILECMKNDWIKQNPEKYRGFWAYCISATGMPHVHMVLECGTAMRFSKVKKIYKTAHVEATKAGRKQVLEYIKKEGKFHEKGEVLVSTLSHGIIIGNVYKSLKTQREVLLKIEELINDGMKPNEIMDQDIRFRKEEAVIRKSYFAKRYKETPPIRDITVNYHIGESGSGKTYTYIQICEESGDENVYLFNDYANKGIGGLDSYCGESILFIDELKPHSLTYSQLLTMLQGYRSQYHARYSNGYCLWTEVHITSVFPPEYIYSGLVNENAKGIDSINQLLRRIDNYVYHYKNKKGEYKTYKIKGDEYIGYGDLIKRAKDDEDI